jgi:hypothetical protein
LPACRAATMQVESTRSKEAIADSAAAAAFSLNSRNSCGVISSFFLGGGFHRAQREVFDLRMRKTLDQITFLLQNGSIHPLTEVKMNRHPTTPPSHPQVQTRANMGPVPSSVRDWGNRLPTRCHDSMMQIISSGYCTLPTAPLIPPPLGLFYNILLTKNPLTLPYVLRIYIFPSRVYFGGNLSSSDSLRLSASEFGGNGLANSKTYTLPDVSAVTMRGQAEPEHKARVGSPASSILPLHVRVGRCHTCNHRLLKVAHIYLLKNSQKSKK